jgi:hypothetical protein
MMTTMIMPKRSSVIDENKNQTDNDPLLRLDCGHLMIENVHFVSNGQQEPLTEIQLKNISREPIQQLVHTLFQLPSRRVDTRVVVELPPAKTLLPREHVVPQEKPLTKWEQFAKAKGIHKQKRSQMIWDESSEQWKPRHGYQRAHKDLTNASSWLEEVTNDKDVDFDPFTEKTHKQTQRMLKNRNQMFQNQEHSMTRSSSCPLTTTMSTNLSRQSSNRRHPTIMDNDNTSKSHRTTSRSNNNDEPFPVDHLPNVLLDQWNSRAISKQSKKSTLHHMMNLNRKSTASLGRFVRPLEGESSLSTRPSPSRSSLLTNLSSEKKTSLTILDRVLKKTQSPHPQTSQNRSL